MSLFDILLLPFEFLDVIDRFLSEIEAKAASSRRAYDIAQAIYRQHSQEYDA